MTIRTLKQVQKSLSNIPPEGCAFNVGDMVTFVNDYGVSFEGLRIIGFDAPCYENGGYIYLDYDCYWFPQKAESLKLEKAGAK